MNADAQLFDALITGNARKVMNELFPRRSPQQPMPGTPALVEGLSPAADTGTAGVGTSPVVRYWTVKAQSLGRTRYVHVEACDAWKATCVVMNRNKSVTCAQVVREIDREEFEALTRVPA
jgi:hypothetical protein